MNIGYLGSLASALVAFVALIVSIVYVGKTDRLGETTDRLNSMPIEREQAERLTAKQADLSANFIKVDKNNYLLKIFNLGKGVVLNVRLVDMDTDNTVLIASDIQYKLPVPLH